MTKQEIEISEEQRQKLTQKADELIKVAHEFFKMKQDFKLYGAVNWIIGGKGELLVFTRMEYKEKILESIWQLHRSQDVKLCGDSFELEEEKEND